MTAIYVFSGIAAFIVSWLTCGIYAGRHYGSRAYTKSKRRWASLDHDTYSADARLAFEGAVLAGPFALAGILVARLVDRHVAEIPEIKTVDQAARLKKLEADLDVAHRQLGIAPLRRTS